MANGEVFSIKRDWPFDKDVAGLHQYVFEGADIEFPRSAALIEFYGTGKVTFEFELDDCVTTREYWRTRSYALEPNAEQADGGNQIQR